MVFVPKLKPKNSPLPPPLLPQPPYPPRQRTRRRPVVAKKHSHMQQRLGAAETHPIIERKRLIHTYISRKKKLEARVLFSLSLSLSQSITVYHCILRAFFFFFCLLIHQYHRLSSLFRLNYFFAPMINDRGVSEKGKKAARQICCLSLSLSPRNRSKDSSYESQ